MVYSASFDGLRVLLCSVSYVSLRGKAKSSDFRWVLIFTRTAGMRWCRSTGDGRGRRSVGVPVQSWNSFGATGRGGRHGDGRRMPRAGGGDLPGGGFCTRF